MLGRLNRIIAIILKRESSISLIVLLPLKLTAASLEIVLVPSNPYPAVINVQSLAIAVYGGARR